MKLFCLLLISNYCFGQFKIGNISIDENTASLYFKNLYLNPDTVFRKSIFDFIGCDNCPLSEEVEQKSKIMAQQFNENLEKFNIGVIIDTIYYVAYTDTIQLDKNKIKLVNIPAGSYTNFKGYLMPRQPCEADFIKWFNLKKQ